MTGEPLTSPVFLMMIAAGLSLSIYTVIDHINDTKHNYSGPFNTMARIWYWTHVVVCVLGSGLALFSMPIFDATVITLIFGILSMTRVTAYSLVVLSVLAVVAAVFNRWA